MSTLKHHKPVDIILSFCCTRKEQHIIIIITIIITTTTTEVCIVCLKKMAQSILCRCNCAVVHWSVRSGGRKCLQHCQYRVARNMPTAKCE